MSITRLAHCPECGRDTEIRVTVEWQPDLCTACGSEVDENVSSTPTDM